MTSELYHYGVKGMKWGVRKSKETPLPSNYSKEQYERDVRVYGKRGANRIASDMSKNGVGVQGARSVEANRINRARSNAQSAAQIARTIGSIAGAIGGYYASSKITKMLSSKFSALNDPSINFAVNGAISMGASSISSSLAGKGAMSVSMFLSGYSPSQYR